MLYDIRRLEDLEDIFKCRIGKYRIVYNDSRKERIVKVIKMKIKESINK